jgi:hypothetical protein
MGSLMPPTASRFLRAASTLEHGSGGDGRSGAREAESAGAAGVRGRRPSAQASAGGDRRRWESGAGTPARGSRGSRRIHPDRVGAGVCGGGDAPCAGGAGALQLPGPRHQPRQRPITTLDVHP